MLKTRISSHYSLDDPRQWKFERTSGLPRAYFARRFRLSPDAWVFITLVLAGIALWLIP